MEIESIFAVLTPPRIPDEVDERAINHDAGQLSLNRATAASYRTVEPRSTRSVWRISDFVLARHPSAISEQIHNRT
jgi:hypothetical protein